MVSRYIFFNTLFKVHSSSSAHRYSQTESSSGRRAIINTKIFSTLFRFCWVGSLCYTSNVHKYNSKSIGTRVSIQREKAKDRWVLQRTKKERSTHDLWLGLTILTCACVCDAWQRWDIWKPHVVWLKSIGNLYLKGADNAHTHTHRHTHTHTHTHLKQCVCLFEWQSQIFTLEKMRANYCSAICRCEKKEI